MKKQTATHFNLFKVAVYMLVFVLISLPFLFNYNFFQRYRDKYNTRLSWSYDHCGNEVSFLYQPMVEMRGSLFKDPLLPAKSVTVSIVDQNNVAQITREYTGKPLALVIPKPAVATTYRLSVTVATNWFTSFQVVPSDYGDYALEIKPCVKGL
jgi:hypothetical protein